MAAIKGLDSLLKKLDKIEGGSQKALKTGMQKAVKLVQGDAKDFCPGNKEVGSSSGALKNSIQSSVEEKRVAVVGKVSTNMEYAPYVEFGTGQRGEASLAPPKYDGRLDYRQDWAGMEAQPYLYPALKQNEAQVQEIIRGELRTAIRKAGK